MTDDKTDDKTVRVTYAEIAAARGITVAAARRLALRHRWPKQVGNEGVSHVVVPVAYMEDIGRAVAPVLDEAAIAAIAKATTDGVTGAMADVLSVIPVLQRAIAALQEQLSAERERANRAEARLRKRRWWRLTR